MVSLPKKTCISHMSSNRFDDQVLSWQNQVPIELHRKNNKMPTENSENPTVHRISRTTVVKPDPSPQIAAQGRKHHLLTPCDLSMISLAYLEWGLAFKELPPSLDTKQVVDRLKASLSAALFHFYPLAGRLITEKHDDGLIISVNCSDINAEGGGEEVGAEIIHASAADKQLALSSDVLGTDCEARSLIRSLFPFYAAINHDGHSLPLLAVQVTELADGIFLGVCMNHAVADGTAFWNFMRSWAEICRADAQEGEKVTISHIPVHERWFVDGLEAPVKLPFSRPDEFIRRFSPNPNLRMRIFHFSTESIAKLKTEANQECKTGNNISSFQALCSLVWRAVTRARRPLPDQMTTCRLASDERLKLSPQLSPDYFGNLVIVIGASTTVAELLAGGLGLGASLLQDRVAAHTDSEIREETRKWLESPALHGTGKYDPLCVSMFSSPRFPVYECDFGWGKPAAMATGSTFMGDGVIASYPGRGGGGGVDLEVCLKAETMEAFESDHEFMSAVSLIAKET